MEFINDLGPIGKFMYASNVSSFRYLNYYFDEQLHETNLDPSVHLMVNAKDTVPPETTCLMINVKISFERLNRLLCDTKITSVVFFKDMFVENIDTNAVCRNIQTVVCYNFVSLNMLNRFFPGVRAIYMFRQNETINGKRVQQQLLPVYMFENLHELHIYSSGSLFDLNAPLLEKLSVYSSFGTWTLDLEKFPHLHTLRIDEKIKVTNEHLLSRPWKILQFFPSSSSSSTPPLPPSPQATPLTFDKLQVEDLILPPQQPYIYNVTKSMAPSVFGVYVNNMSATRILNLDVVSVQVYDPIYPLKMCSLRFNSQFYKYFPFADEVNNNMVERFNIQRQRENLIMIFNFDFMYNIMDGDNNWSSWYNACIETYHRMPIIIQNGQLMLTDVGGGGGTNDVKEKTWPNTVTKIRKECCIFLPEEELIYINCSPMRLQTLVDKILMYRRQRFIINKLWLVTNGFEIKTKDIEERIENLVIVHNQVKMYINF